MSGSYLLLWPPASNTHVLDDVDLACCSMCWPALIHAGCSLFFLIYVLYLLETPKLTLLNNASCCSVTGSDWLLLHSSQACSFLHQDGCSKRHSFHSAMLTQPMRQSRTERSAMSYHGVSRPCKMQTSDNIQYFILEKRFETRWDLGQLCLWISTCGLCCRTGGEGMRASSGAPHIQSTRFTFCGLTTQDCTQPFMWTSAMPMSRLSRYDALQAPSDPLKGLLIASWGPWSEV